MITKRKSQGFGLLETILGLGLMLAIAAGMSILYLPASDATRVAEETHRLTQLRGDIEHAYISAVDFQGLTNTTAATQGWLVNGSGDTTTTAWATSRSPRRTSRACPPTAGRATLADVPSAACEQLVFAQRDGWTHVYVDGKELDATATCGEGDTHLMVFGAGGRRARRGPSAALRNWRVARQPQLLRTACPLLTHPPLGDTEMAITPTQRRRRRGQPPRLVDWSAGMGPVINHTVRAVPLPSIAPITGRDPTGIINALLSVDETGLARQLAQSAPALNDAVPGLRGKTPLHVAARLYSLRAVSPVRTDRAAAAVLGRMARCWTGCGIGCVRLCGKHFPHRLTPKPCSPLRERSPSEKPRRSGWAGRRLKLRRPSSAARRAEV